MWHTDTMEYYLAVRNNEIMPYAVTWIDLEIVILSEVRHFTSDKDKYMILFICRIQKNGNKKPIYKTEIESQI